MAAIRIIRNPAPPSPDMAMIEREEMLQAIAERIAEASGSPEILDECAQKLRDVAVQSEEADELLQAIDIGLQSSVSPIGVHAELDLTRIFSLLED